MTTETRATQGKPNFQWDDPLLLDQQLTDEERMVRDSASRYAQERLQPRILDAFRNETADPSIFREMGELGLLGTSIPAEYGGAGPFPPNTAALGSTTFATGWSRARSSVWTRATAP